MFITIRPAAWDEIHRPDLFPKSLKLQQRVSHIIWAWSKIVRPVEASASWSTMAMMQIGQKSNRSKQLRKPSGARPRVKEKWEEAATPWRVLYEPRIFEGLPVRVMKPFGFDAGKSYPLILSLHGAGGKGRDNKRQLKDWNRQLADERRRKEFPCYVVAPQVTELWNAQHLATIKSLLKTLDAVDRSRIYVLGHSMGGHGTYIFIQLDTHYFAAAAPSAGSGLRKTEEFIDPNKVKDIPIWAFHGDKDNVCPIQKDQKVFDAMKRLGGNMKFTVWQGDNHGVSGKMIPGSDNNKTLFSSERCGIQTDFMTWLFAQSLRED